MSSVDPSDGSLSTAGNERPKAALVRSPGMQPTRFVPITRKDQVWLTLSMLVCMGLAVAIAQSVELPFFGVAILGGVLGGTIGAALGGGRQRLRAAVRRLDDLNRRAAALEDLKRLVDGGLRVEAVAVDALGHLTLEALERGDLQEAIARVRRIAELSRVPVRRRLPRIGFFGEAVASSLGRLFDETNIAVVPGQAFVVSDKGGGEEAAPELLLLVHALRVLEACDTGQIGAVVREINELPRDDLRRRYPLLATLVHARASEVASELAVGLVEAIRELSPPQRQLFEKRFPLLRLPTDATYRELAPEATTSLALRSAPEALRALEPSKAPTQWMPVMPRAFRNWVWVYVCGAVIMAAVGEISITLLPSVAFLGWLALGGTYHSHTRVRPFIKRGLDSPPRLRELRRMRTRGSSKKGDIARIYPFERGDLMLVLGLHQAERALEAGDLEEASEQIGWWLAGADEATIAQTDPTAIAASAIRVAALLGMHQVAERMSRGFEVTPWRGRMRARSGHGDAPRALALARALLHATVQRWSEAAAEIATAGEAPPVEHDAFEHTLYGTLLRRVRAQQHPIPAELTSLAEAANADWVARIWPEV